MFNILLVDVYFQPYLPIAGYLVASIPRSGMYDPHNFLYKPTIHAVQWLFWVNSDLTFDLTLCACAEVNMKEFCSEFHSLWNFVKLSIRVMYYVFAHFLNSIFASFKANATLCWYCSSAFEISLHCVWRPFLFAYSYVIFLMPHTFTTFRSNQKYFPPFNYSTQKDTVLNFLLLAIYF